MDGSRYYATVRLVARSGAVGAFVSDAAPVDGTAPVIQDVRLGLAPSGAEVVETAFVDAAASLTAAWTVREPHTPTLVTTLTLWAGAAVAAEVTVAEPRTGRHTFGVALQSGVAYRVELHAQGFLRRGMARGAWVADCPPGSIGRRDGAAHSAPPGPVSRNELFLFFLLRSGRPEGVDGRSRLNSGGRNSTAGGRRLTDGR